MIDSARRPERADRSALGSLPTRAYRYCDAVTMAAGYGWYVAPPIDLSLLWDGQQIMWRCPGLGDWMPLGAAQFPHFAARFDAAAPEGMQEYSPPFLTALQEPGLVQIWTGLAARTAPGWSLLVRGLANLPQHPGYEPYEGLLEADRWFGPLISNLRLTRTNVPIELRAGEPFLQAQPVPQVAYADAILGNAGFVERLEDFGPEDWAGYHAAIVAPNQDPHREPGRYAIEGRKRRRGTCPHMAAQLAAQGQAQGQTQAPT
jgi:hypothetical protein